MKAGELRIGNYIQDFNDNMLEVIGLHEPLIYSIYPIGLKTNKTTTNAKEIEPIPLTEEWLLKFGFEKTKQGSVKIYNAYVKNEYSLTKNKILDLWNFCINEPSHQTAFLNNIIYVHQLQNLYFALTGEELKVREQAAS